MSDFPDFNEEDIEKSEVIEPPEAMTERSAARRIVLQVLYEVDSTSHPFAQVIVSRLQEEALSKRTERYVRQLVKGVMEHWVQLDTAIRQYAAERPLEQLSIVDRNILRLGIYELASEPNTSESITVNEAIELTDVYGAEGSARFINGVLGALLADGQEALQHILIAPESKDGH